MKAKLIIGATVELIVKVVVLAAIVMFVMNTSVKAYDYGYRVFAEEPVSLGEGRTISVIVEEADSVADIGQMLQERGLIRDAKLFTVQELLSEQHGKIKPGIYDLSTSMTGQEMLAVMAADIDSETEEAGTEASGGETGTEETEIEETGTEETGTEETGTEEAGTGETETE